MAVPRLVGLDPRAVCTSSYVVSYFCHCYDCYSQDLGIVCYCRKPLLRHVVSALVKSVAAEDGTGRGHGMRDSGNSLSRHDRSSFLLPHLGSVVPISRCYSRFRAPFPFDVGESGGRRWRYACVSRQPLSTQLARQQVPVSDRFLCRESSCGMCSLRFRRSRPARRKPFAPWLRLGHLH